MVSKPADRPRRWSTSATAGVVVLALVAVAVYSLAQIVCYILRMCSGDYRSYAMYSLVAIASIYLLGVVYFFLSRIQKKR